MNEATAPDRPFAAGMYDYLLGGTANTAVDRATVEQMIKVLPEMREGAWANRGFLQRAVARMAGEWGINQFLDLGAGLPTQRHTHEVVRELRPDGRVVYVDIDPRVIERGTKLLADESGAAVFQADIRDAERVLAAPETRALIDFDRPVGLLMVAVTHFLKDEDDPWDLVRRYVDAVPSGSYLAISAPTADKQAARIRDAMLAGLAKTPTPAVERSMEEFSRFLDGLEIVPPYSGADPVVAHIGQWGAEDPVEADDDGSRWWYAAVARKP
ncbi:SAM-dependent methyltransferase [Cryptosporangium minutisporangium]|uniref:SAM-dependent methyltransferase n=1 Tax=Cryptosporangium minutisporangium TaxID=113569 RepID=A0ABP6STX9_9ACTN